MTRPLAIGSLPLQRIHGRTASTERSLYCAPPDESVHVPTIADLVPVTEIMTRGMTCARRDLPGTELAELMVRDHIGCIPVVEDPGRPVGMVTKLDLVEQMCTSQGIGTLTAGEVMMPLALTLGERASVAHAAA